MFRKSDKNWYKKRLNDVIDPFVKEPKWKFDMKKWLYLLQEKVLVVFSFEVIIKISEFLSTVRKIICFFFIAYY